MEQFWDDVALVNTEWPRLRPDVSTLRRPMAPCTGPWPARTILWENGKWKNHQTRGSKQAGGEMPSHRSHWTPRRPMPCHDVAGLDFPHAILVCWGALGGARGVLHTRSARCSSSCACHAMRSKQAHDADTHLLPPRIMTLRGWSIGGRGRGPARKSLHTGVASFFLGASCAQPPTTHLAAVSQASRRPCRTRLVPVRLAEGEIEREMPPLQRPVQLLLLVSFGTSSCAGVLLLSQVHFSERIWAKAQVVVARCRQAGQCKNVQKPNVPIPTPRLAVHPGFSVSPSLLVPPFCHSEENRGNLRLATPFFFGSSPRTVCRRSFD